MQLLNSNKHDNERAPGQAQNLFGASGADTQTRRPSTEMITPLRVKNNVQGLISPCQCPNLASSMSASFVGSSQPPRSLSALFQSTMASLLLLNKQHASASRHEKSLFLYGDTNISTTPSPVQTVNHIFLNPGAPPCAVTILAPRASAIDPLTV